jgi:PAS domain S-box-containing protein
LDDLLARVVAQGNLPRSLATILEWTRTSLHADGIALFQAEKGAAGAVQTQASFGSLAATAPLLAEELSRTGIPRLRGILALSSASCPRTDFYCCPVNMHEGTPWNALLLQGPRIEESVRSHEEDLQVSLAHLRNMLGRERGDTTAAEPPVVPPPAEGILNLAVVTDSLRIPLYVCDAQGSFISASPACLELTGYPDVEALSRSHELFREPDKRESELETVRRLGKVESFPLSLRSGSGATLQVRDTAVFLGGSILGMFFDVTELVAANAELKDALQVQELLNDSIMAGAQLLQRTQGASIRTLARLAEYRDQETGYHLQRICEYTRLMAMQVHHRAPFPFRVTVEYANDISLSSMLHDIGKVSIPDHILLKPGKLDPAEWEIMKKHTVFGWEVLHKADRELGEQSFLTLAATIALAHHERYDVTGYPKGTAGEEIPLSARISAIADVYDALTSWRPYKEAWSHERAMSEMNGQAGTHFDPVLIEIFRDLGGEFAEVRRRYPG